MIRDTSENIGQIGLRIDAAHLCGFDDGIDTSGALSADIGATEEIILATENRRSHAALGGVVAHFQPTVRQVAQQRVPSCESIANGPGECALAADPFQRSLKKQLQLDQSRPGILDAREQALVRWLAANAALDDEQGGDALDRFQRDRRGRGVVNVVEFPAYVTSTRHLDQRRHAVRRGGPIETVEAGIAPPITQPSRPILRTSAKCPLLLDGHLPILTMTTRTVPHFISTLVGGHQPTLTT